MATRSRARTKLLTTRSSGQIVEWKGKFGWIQPDEPIAHASATKNKGRIYLALADMEGEVSGAGSHVSFFVYADNSGLGAMNCKPEAPGVAKTIQKPSDKDKDDKATKPAAQAAAPKAASTESTDEKIPLQRFPSKDGVLKSTPKAAGVDIKDEKLNLKRVPSRDDVMRSTPKAAGVDIKDEKLNLKRTPSRDDVMRSTPKAGAPPPKAGINNDGLLKSMPKAGAPIAPVAPKVGGILRSTPKAKPMSLGPGTAPPPNTFVPKAAPAPAVNKTGRKRVSDQPIVGKVKSWSGDFGWVVPDEKVDHPMYRGKVYLHRSDIDTQAVLQVGQPVMFFAYTDPQGFGAENCTVLDKDGMPVDPPSFGAGPNLLRSSAKAGVPPPQGAPGMMRAKPKCGGPAPTIPEDMNPELARRLAAWMWDRGG